VDFERNQVVVRGGKGAKDRVTVLPESLRTGHGGTSETGGGIASAGFEGRVGPGLAAGGVAGKLGHCPILGLFSNPPGKACLPVP